MIPQYIEDGFIVKAPGPVPTGPPNYKLARNGGGDSHSPENGTAYLQTGATDKVDIFAADGSAFYVTSVDLAEYSTVFYKPEVTFVGTTAAGSTVSVTYTIDGFIDGTGPGADFQTFVFPNDFQNLVNLQVQGYGYSLDNLVVQIPGVPDAAYDHFHVPDSELSYLPVLANDIGAPLTIVGVTPGAHGSVTTDGTTVSYTPGPDWNGTDDFTYTVANRGGKTDTATVLVSDFPPVAMPDDAVAPPGGSVLIPVLNNDTDEDGDTLAVSEVHLQSPQDVTAVVEGQAIRFTAGPTASGTVDFTYTADDLHGGRTTGHVSVFVRPAALAITAPLRRGGNVPGAGTDPRIAAGAVWTSFGPPAINGSGTLAFLGRWRKPASPGTPPSPERTGIFAGDHLVVGLGDTVPGAGTVPGDGRGYLPADAIFLSFTDPVLDDLGHTAFLAVIGGTGVGPRNNHVLASDGRSGSLEIIARTGENPIPYTDLQCRAITSVSIQATPHLPPGPPNASQAGITFTATLGSDTPGFPLPAKYNAGAYWLPQGGNGLIPLVRKGDSQDFLGDVRSYRILEAGASIPGQGRGALSGQEILLQMSFSRGYQALQRIQPAEFRFLTFTYSYLDSTLLPNSQWQSFGLPSADRTGEKLAVLGALVPVPTDGLPVARTRGIFLSGDRGRHWEPLARVLDPAPGFARGARFRSFREPVHSSTGEAMAFLATADGGQGLWWRPEGGDLTLVARAGGRASFAGAPPGARWISFTSLALPGEGLGPLFTATVGRGDATDPGLYGMDTTGELHELLRPNQTLAGKKVRTFHVLKAVSGSAGVTRSFNDHGQVATLVTFTDGSTAIARIDLP